MRTRSVPAALLVAVLAAAGAVGCFVEFQKLRTQADWLLERGTAEGQQYAETFEGAAADQQLATLNERHAVLDQAALWQRGQLFLILFSVVAAFSSYVFFLFARIRAAREEADAAIPQEHVRVHEERVIAAHAAAHSH